MLSASPHRPAQPGRRHRRRTCDPDQHGSGIGGACSSGKRPARRACGCGGSSASAPPGRQEQPRHGSGSNAHRYKRWPLAPLPHDTCSHARGGTCPEQGVGTLSGATEGAPGDRRRPPAGSRSGGLPARRAGRGWRRNLLTGDPGRRDPAASAQMSSRAESSSHTCESAKSEVNYGNFAIVDDSWGGARSA